MDREAAKLLRDAAKSRAAIFRITDGRTKEEMSDDRMLRSSMFWEFAVIGEAPKRLRHSHPSIAETISHLDDIIAFRNVLVHGYDIVNDDEVWPIVQRDLPVLNRELRELVPDEPNHD